MHVTIEETDEGFLLCLHLLPSETSRELRAFASSRPGRSQLPPRLSSTVQRTVSRLVEPVPPANLDVGVGVRPRGPSRETIIQILDAAITASKPPIVGVIGGLSRGIGNLMFGTGIDPRAGVSISEQLAELTDQSVAEVHTRLLSPFLGESGLGPAAVGAITNDYRSLAGRGDVEALEGNQELLEGLRESAERAINFPAPLPAGGPGAGTGRQTRARGARLLKSVKSLETHLKTNLILARRVAGAP